MKSKSAYLSLLFLLITIVLPAQVLDNELIGKVFCGYQGWFNCEGDGSPRDAWVHWGGNPPSPGNLSFEVYPDLTDYQESSLFQTGFGNFGDGQPAKLFSSYKEDVIDVHCQWTEKYGIDGLALQRFLGPVLSSSVIKENRDSIAVRLKRSAEKHGTLYYLMYDMAPDNVAGFKGDVEHMESNLKFMDSPNYAHSGGKPVICLWGIGFSHRDGDGYAVNSQTIIDWLHDKGYYVIAGVNDNWRTDPLPGYISVYESLDMISPWTPGRYRHVEGALAWKSVLSGDKVLCDELGIDYQPVIFSGFAWSNWNGGDANSYPRHKGEFLWAQVKNIIELEIPNIYVAMFDEYDEGTNVMKMADSYLSIPTDQYFLTSSADGAYISSDFYLRLTGQASKVLKGEAPLTDNVTLPFTEGPVYIRTSFEPGYDGLPDWTNVEDESGSINMDGLQCGHVQENPFVGSYSLKFEANDNSATESYAAMKVFDVNTPVYGDLKLMFRSYPTNEISRFASIDLVLNDGTTLSSYNAKDTRGNLMLASSGRGVVNEWTKTICRIGEWLDTATVTRDTIDKIIIAYNHPEETGVVQTYFEDISIYRLDTDEVEYDNAVFDSLDVPTEMEPGETVSVSLTVVNSGTLAWSASKGYKLLSQNPENNSVWGTSSIDFGVDTIYGGEKKTFTFDITAPDAIGKYSFQWQLAKQDENEGTLWIGEKSKNVVISVGSIDGTSYTEIYDGIISRRAEINDDENAEKAFDNLYTSGEKNVDWSKWLDNGGIPTESNPSWIQIEFPDAVVVNMLTVVSGNDAPERDPENFRLKGSNDGESWEIIYSVEGQVFNSRFEEKLFAFENTSGYSFYRFETTKNKGDDSMTQLCEIRLIQLGVYLQLPGKASNPKPTHNSDEIMTESVLSWSPGLNSTSHDVYFGTTNPPEFVINQTDTVFNPGNLLKSKTYFWRINEKNDDGTKVGDVWSFKTEQGYFDAVFVSQSLPKDILVKGESMNVTVVMKNSGEQSWAASDNVALYSQNPTYNITWGINTIAMDDTDNIEPGMEKAFNFSIKAPSTPGDYDFQWQMRSIDGWFGELSENKIVTVVNSLGVEPSLKQENIQILNPGNKGELVVKTDNIFEPVNIGIYNLKGQKIQQLSSSDQITHINISDYSKGVYLIKVMSGSHLCTELVIVR